MSLELLTALQPAQPPRWGIVDTISPGNWMRLESSCIGEDDEIQKAAGRLVFNTLPAEIAVSAGDLSAGSVVTELASPLPAIMSAGHPYSLTPLTASVKVPQSLDAITNGSFALELNTRQLSLFYLQESDGSMAGGGKLSFLEETVSIALTAHHTTLEDYQSRSWFSLHPYVPEQQLTSWLATARCTTETHSGTAVTVEESAGCAGFPPQIAPPRWFSRTGIIVHCLDETLMVTGEWYAGDLDYLTVKGTRIRDTLRVGGGILWKPAGTLQTGFAATRTCHIPETLRAKPYWQTCCDLSCSWKTASADYRTTLTYTDLSAERKDRTIAWTGRLSVAEAGTSIALEGPFRYVYLRELATGTLTVWLKPGAGFRLEGAATIKEAVLHKVTAELQLKTAHTTHILTASCAAEKQSASVSYRASAQWK
ncbi:MAG: hypothetical protein MJ178_08930 [Treponemataceae bacterium]|nr:hypothetical protein [Treponemataceae bacterium]